MVFHLFIEQIIVMAVMNNFVLVNDLFALSLRFSDDEDLLQRELERKCWKAGRLVCCRLAGREEGRQNYIFAKS